MEQEVIMVDTVVKQTRLMKVMSTSMIVKIASAETSHNHRVFLLKVSAIETQSIIDSSSGGIELARI